MEIVCQQSDLNIAIQLVNKAVSSRPTHPILSNILFTADEVTNKISLTGFDLNLGIQTSFDAGVDKSGAITIPSKILSEIVSKLPSESPVTLKVEEDTENILLQSDRGSFNLKGIASDDYPKLPFVESGTSLDINPAGFLQALKLTMFSSSNDESKQLLTGVNFKFKDQSLESAATDGHRLAVVLTSEGENFSKLEMINNLNTGDDYLSVTIPTRSLREIEKLVNTKLKEDTIKLFYDKGQVVFISSNQIITTRTLEGNYPNYAQLIPDNFSKVFKFERNLIINSLERIAVLADQQSSVVKININDDNFASISADAQDIGNAKELLPVSFNCDQIEIAFNVRYLLEGLRVISSENILLKCNLPTTPAVLVPDDDSSFTYLVMPVQVRS
mgnify:FL=1